MARLFVQSLVLCFSHHPSSSRSFFVRNVIRFATNKSSVYPAGGKQSGVGFHTLAERGQFGVLQFLEVAHYFHEIAKPKLSWTFLFWIFGESSSMLSAFPSIG